MTKLYMSGLTLEPSLCNTLVSITANGTPHTSHDPNTGTTNVLSAFSMATSAGTVQRTLAQAVDEIAAGALTHASPKQEAEITALIGNIAYAYLSHVSAKKRLANSTPSSASSTHIPSKNSSMTTVLTSKLPQEKPTPNFSSAASHKVLKTTRPENSKQTTIRRQAPTAISSPVDKKENAYTSMLGLTAPTSDPPFLDQDTPALPYHPTPEGTPSLDQVTPPQFSDPLFTVLAEELRLFLGLPEENSADKDLTPDDDKMQPASSMQKTTEALYTLSQLAMMDFLITTPPQNPPTTPTFLDSTTSTTNIEEPPLK
jgi:hypothetical protein